MENTLPLNSKPAKPGLRQRAKTLLGAFRRDERGINCVEFAFAAPFLLILMGGLSTVLELENASAQVGKTTSTIADIISQSPTVDSFAVSNAFKAADSLIPRSGNFEAYLAGVQVTASGVPVVLWATPNRKLKNLVMPEPGDRYNRLPDDLKNREGFVVVTHGQMSYSPAFGGDFIKGKNGDGIATFDYSNYFIPRVSITTLCNACEQTYPDE